MSKAKVPKQSIGMSVNADAAKAIRKGESATSKPAIYAALSSRVIVFASFITMATVGYGDLTPVSDLARAMAVGEAIIGQLYLVSVVSMAVGRLGVGAVGGTTVVESIEQEDDE